MTWRVPRHVFQARAPSRNPTKYRADDLSGNLICEYFCWMLGDMALDPRQNSLFEFLLHDLNFQLQRLNFTALFRILHSCFRFHIKDVFSTYLSVF